jgi:hypothetical protein
MTKNKYLLIIVAAILLIAVLAMAVPAFASDVAGSANPARITQVNKAKILARLLLVQDEAKVDAFIAKAVAADKLNADQALKLKNFWTEHHSQFLKNQILIRLLKVQDQGKLQSYLDKSVQAGKIQPAQADKIMQAWKILHSPTK